MATLLVATSLFVAGLPSTAHAAANDDSEMAFKKSSEGSALGKALGAGFESGVEPALPVADTPPEDAPPQGSILASRVFLKILGLGLEALNAINTPANTIDGVSYAEFYSFGKRVFSQQWHFGMDGNAPGFTAGFAPTEIRVPFVVYPIGPVKLQVDGGVRFLADVRGQLIPQILINPPSLSSVQAEFHTVASGAGFIEGYASALVVRAGAGGQLNLVNASADLSALFMMDGSKPFVTLGAKARFLSGRLYAFVDTFSLWKFKFKRWIDHTLYDWQGYCFAAGAQSCE